MAQSNVNIRMDEDIKREFDRVCDALGITMTVAITMLAKKMIREQRVPFDVSLDPFYSVSNTAALRASAAELEQGKTVTRSLAELEALANG